VTESEKSLVDKVKKIPSGGFKVKNCEHVYVVRAQHLQAYGLEDTEILEILSHLYHNTLKEIDNE